MENENPYLEKTLLLCAAVGISICFVSIALFAANHGTYSDITSPVKISSLDSKGANPAVIASVGILAMVASPFIWVVVALTSFIARKNVLYSFLTSLVLLLMIASIILSSA